MIENGPPPPIAEKPPWNIDCGHPEDALVWIWPATDCVYIPENAFPPLLVVTS